MAVLSILLELAMIGESDFNYRLKPLFSTLTVDHLEKKLHAPPAKQILIKYF